MTFELTVPPSSGWLLLAGLGVAVATRRDRGTNPEFYTAADGDVHPLRGSADYDELATHHGQQRTRRLAAELEETHPSLAQQLRDLLLGRGAPAQVERRYRQLDQQAERAYAKDAKIVRPGWARGWSQHDLQDLAEYSGISRSERFDRDWTDQLDAMQVWEYWQKLPAAKRHHLGLPKSQLAKDPEYQRQQRIRTRERTHPKNVGRKVAAERRAVERRHAA